MEGIKKGNFTEWSRKTSQEKLTLGSALFPLKEFSQREWALFSPFSPGDKRIEGGEIETVH